MFDALCLIYLYQIFYITTQNRIPDHNTPPDDHRTPMFKYPHGLSCDGVQIAKDDMSEIENDQKWDETLRELFQNAMRIRKAMRINPLLRPIFHKYKRTCREILQQKKDEVNQLLVLCDYCDSCNNHDGSNHELRLIHSELREINTQINGLEEMDPNLDSESDSSHSDADDASDASDDDASDDDASLRSHSSSSHSSSSSSSSHSSCNLDDISDFCD